MDKHLYNIRLILRHTNATPIRGHDGIGYLCAYCQEQYPDPSQLKRHVWKNHGENDIKKFMRAHPIRTYVVKIDITSLQCTICDERLNAFDESVHHLTNQHEKVWHADINNHILPFKFDGDVVLCSMCTKSSHHFKNIQEHMNVHYTNYLCEICNAPFINSRTLQCHLARHKKGSFPCSFCSKIFDTNGKRSNHERSVHIGNVKRSKCPYCSEKFATHKKRTDHMVEIHGAQRVVLQCNACDKTFLNRANLTTHTNRDHLMERRHECRLCDKKFYDSKCLKEHMIKHSGVRKYTCDVCFKSYGRRHTLMQHLRIHADDRRFKCEHCEQAFVQKCSLKQHLLSKHSDVQQK
jgi:hypothetical protein